MKLIRKKNKTPPKQESETVPIINDAPNDDLETAAIQTNNHQESAAWKVLIVDDEEDVHTITRLTLKNFSFAGKEIIFLNAMSGKEAREILIAHPDIAVAMIDVVMETEDAGLRLVNFVRNELKNRNIRLIIRTGQPGAAPERYVIDHYDIDDYKDKTELIAQKLYTAVRSAIKSYRDIIRLERNRYGLEKILKAAPKLYQIQPMKEFFEGVLTQIISLCLLGDDNLIFTVHGFLAISKNDEDISVQVGTGRFAKKSEGDEIKKIAKALYDSNIKLPEKSLLIPMKIYDQIRAFVYLEDTGLIIEDDKNLLKVMANQCASAMENLNLFYHLEEAERIRKQKDEFIGMAAHDLRTPLGGILNVVEVLMMDMFKTVDADNREFIKLLKSTAQYSLDLVNNLLDIAKMESGKIKLEFQPVDLSWLMARSLEVNRFSAESKNIELSIESNSNISDIMIDAAKIKQVLNNLISNAIKYSHPGTKVILAYSMENENNILISIKDQGQGIPKDEIDNLFKPFTKTTVRGTGGEPSTGLGLFICKKIAEAHGGQIWVESEVGSGSTFYVSLPVPT